MLFLQFRIGADLLALPAAVIVEIVPLGAVRTVRGDSHGSAGASAGMGVASFDYRGGFIPALDLSLRETGLPTPRLLSTRIVVVRAASGLVGLIAQQATTMLRLDPADFAPFAKGPDGLVQRVELADLLPSAMMRGAA